MMRIKPVVMNNTDAETSKTLQAVNKKLGMLPNLFTTLAHSPSALNSYLQISEILSKGQLTAKQRELISIAVAQKNSCEYCLSAHAAIGKSVGLDIEEISGARIGIANNPLDKEIVSFAIKLVGSRGDINNTDLEKIRDMGSDGMVIEIIANVAMNILSNYVNRVANTEIDFPKLDL